MESPEDPQVTSPGAHEPLAARMRPLSLSEIAGQQHILGEGKLLRRAIEAEERIITVKAARKKARQPDSITS